MSKGNYFFLGIAISYFIVAIIQWNIPGALSATVFVTVAFISLELTISETFKIILDGWLNNYKSIINVAKERLLEIENILPIIKKYPSLKEDVNKLQDEKAYITDIIQTKEQSKTVSFIEKAYSLLFALQIVICTIQIIITPLKLIPYDIITTKTINIVTLLTFSIMFLSYFISNIGKDSDERMRIKLLANKKTSEYYLNLLKQIHKEQEDKQGVI